MLKKTLHIISLLMAVYIASVGCGVNIQHYCSHECAEHHQCCHHHHHTCHCGVEIGEACHCGVTHIAAPDSNSPDDFSLLPIINCCTVDFCNTSITEPTLAAIHLTHISHAPPILQTGRSILTEISLLLI